MLKEYLEIGKIVGTHGIRGELRIECWCDSPEFISKFKTLYFNEGKEKLSVIARPHKNIALMKIDGIDSVEQADLLRGRVLYMKRSDAKLNKGTYFIQDLLGLEVRESSSQLLHGTVTDVIKTGANDVYEVKDSSGKAYYVPVIKSVVKEIDIENGCIYVESMKGLWDDED